MPDKAIAKGSGSGAIVSTTSFHLNNGKIAPVEIIESEFPTRVEVSLDPDSTRNLRLVVSEPKS